ncbi:MAG: TonB-dependent receptor [Pseudomonadota bacterium]
MPEARAQSTAPETGEAPATLAPIIVTTRRTQERLRDVPGSVVVLESQEIERSNITTSTRLIERLPNVSFNEGSNRDDLQITIRGISNIVGGAATGPTNGVFVDGVLLNPTGGSIGINPNLFDLERVETAFGPQGTAFGRGTIGGAINFVPKKPTEDLEFEVTGTAGSFPNGLIRGVANIPLLENGLLSARIVGFGAISDGFIDLTTLDESNGSSDFGGRISLRSQPTDRLTLDVTASYDRSEFDAPNTATISSAEDGDPVSSIDFIDEDILERSLFTGDIAYDLDFGTLTSKTSYLDVEVQGIDDADFTSFDLITSDVFSEDTAISQEFRFESEEFILPASLGTIRFNPGVSFSFNETRTSSLVESQPGFFEAATVFAEDSGLLPSGLGLSIVDDGSFGNVISIQEVNTLGVFGDVRWRPIEALELTAGARFTRDRVKVTGESIGSGLFATSVAAVELSPGGPVIPFPTGLDPVFPTSPETIAEETFSAFTPNASILYEWNEDVTTFFNFSTGFRAGGFSALPSGLEPFDEERVQSFEAGFRINLLDNRLQLRGAGFLLDYEDIQVVSTTDVVGITVVDNAAEARSVGAELGFTALPVNGLRVDVDWGLNFAKFTDFSTSPFGDLSGESLPNAPRHTVSVALDYEHPLHDFVVGNSAAFIRAENAFTSSFSNLVDPDSLVFDGRNLLNFRVGLRGESFEFEAFVENALNEAVVTGTVSGIADFLLGDSVETNVDIQETRQFGVRARVLF